MLQLLIFLIHTLGGDKERIYTAHRKEIRNLFEFRELTGKDKERFFDWLKEQVQSTHDTEYLQIQAYNLFRKTITINLLDFILFPQHDSIHTIGQLWTQKKKQILSDDIKIHFTEIPKLVKQWHDINKSLVPLPLYMFHPLSMSHSFARGDIEPVYQTPDHIDESTA